MTFENYQYLTHLDQQNIWDRVPMCENFKAQKHSNIFRV